MDQIDRDELAVQKGFEQSLVSLGDYIARKEIDWLYVLQSTNKIESYIPNIGYKLETIVSQLVGIVMFTEQHMAIEREAQQWYDDNSD